MKESYENVNQTCHKRKYADQIIIALDVKDIKSAYKLVDTLKNIASFYKVGMELLAQPGALDLVKELKQQGHKVFLDAKLYDIGRTVEAAVANYAALEIDFLTIHAEYNTVKAAVKATHATQLKLLAVTVMTNMNDGDLRLMGIDNMTVEQLVKKRALQSYELGAHGIISSAQEANMIRNICGEKCIICTPGIRPKGFDSNDQKRVVTPQYAFQNGADYIVMGRAITQADNPQKVLTMILQDLNNTAT